MSAGGSRSPEERSRGCRSANAARRAWSSTSSAARFPGSTGWNYYDRRGFRAAVDSAYRAGYGQGRDDEAGDCPLGSDALGPLDHVVAHHEDRTHAEIADVKRGEDQ